MRARYERGIAERQQIRGGAPARTTRPRPNWRNSEPRVTDCSLGTDGPRPSVNGPSDTDAGRAPTLRHRPNAAVVAGLLGPLSRARAGPVLQIRGAATGPLWICCRSGGRSAAELQPVVALDVAASQRHNAIPINAAEKVARPGLGTPTTAAARGRVRRPGQGPRSEDRPPGSADTQREAGPGDRGQLVPKPRNDRRLRALWTETHLHR